MDSICWQSSHSLLICYSLWCFLWKQGMACKPSINPVQTFSHLGSFSCSKQRSLYWWGRHTDPHRHVHGTEISSLLMWQQTAVAHIRVCQSHKCLIPGALISPLIIYSPLCKQLELRILVEWRNGHFSDTRTKITNTLGQEEVCFSFTFHLL